MYGSIGMNLKVLRLRNRLKQVALNTGISRYLIGLFERYKMIPTEEKLEKLAEFYGVSVEEITVENR